MTSQLDHARALRRIKDYGATDDQARELLAALVRDGWRCHRVDPDQHPPREVTGRADDDVRATYLAAMRADLATAKRQRQDQATEPAEATQD